MNNGCNNTILRDVTDSCGAVVYKKSELGTEVLLIRSRHGWSFPKGHIEPGETQRQTALREVMEETGVTARIAGDFKREVPSCLARDERKVIFFLAEYVAGELCPNLDETQAAAWALAADAVAMVGYPPDRRVLLDALAELSQA